MTQNEDCRPKTVVLLQFTGIGDLVWHVQYFKAVAQHSKGGLVTVMAQPSTFAHQLLAHEPWVREVIDHDHRPRRNERRRAAHAGLAGMWRMALTLRKHEFERIVLFSGRPSRGLLAALSRIPQRLGYGYNLIQRLFLNHPPYIKRYNGPAVAVLKETADFAIAHGFCETPLTPRISVTPDAIQTMHAQLADMPRPLYVLAIGSSEEHKQWGAAKFSGLAERLSQSGAGIVLLGGPAEHALAEDIKGRLSAQAQSRVRALTSLSIQESAATLQCADICVGNDTGMVNMAAAVGRRTYVLLGARKVLDHDALIIGLRATSLDALTVEDAFAAMTESLSLHPMPNFAVRSV